MSPSTGPLNGLTVVATATPIPLTVPELGPGVVVLAPAWYVQFDLDTGDVQAIITTAEALAENAARTGFDFHEGDELYFRFPDLVFPTVTALYRIGAHEQRPDGWLRLPLERLP